MINQTEEKAKGTVDETKKWLGYGLALVLALGTFVSGVYIGKTNTFLGRSVPLGSLFPSAREAASAEDVNLQEFWKVWQLLEQKYVTSTSTPLSAEERVQGAIAGLVGTATLLVCHHS